MTASLLSGPDWCGGEYLGPASMILGARLRRDRLDTDWHTSSPGTLFIGMQHALPGRALPMMESTFP